MTTTDNFFTESQRQFNESQKKLADIWDESQKQFTESQKKLFYTWVENFPKGTVQADVSEIFQKSLSFQRDLVSNILTTQQLTLQLSIETQKQFWNNYFHILQSNTYKTKSTTTTSNQ
jgi:hypothetical protein